MLLLILFAFLAGLVTILSPCILPLLPIILAGSATKNRYRPIGVVTGFVGSFTVFTLTLTTLVKATGISPDSLRNLAVIVLLLFGLLLVVPSLKHLWESFTSRLTPASSGTRHGFWGGILIGLSLGLVWTPCVGPILASVITLAASSSITTTTILITLAYSLGTAIPLFLIMRGSAWFMSRFGWLKASSNRLQQLFGVLMILAALVLYFQLDRRFQTYILDRFPSYGAGLTAFENNPQIESNLNNLITRKGNMNAPLEDNGPSPELLGGQSWLNSDPLTLAELRGKVVLVDFWTYSCINCIRTLPYLKAWHDKYRDDGLVVIGVHSPEFEFEKSLDNLSRAIQDFGITYPIVQDNDFAIWRAYRNRYWPAKYLIDREGKIRYTHFGEGKYDETEIVIQELLGETTASDLVDMPAYQHESRSPETYLGYWRLANVVSSPNIVKDQLTSYSSPISFPTNSVGFEGEWLVTEKYAVASSGSSLLFRFDAKEVNLVMAPANEHRSPSTTIYLDGQKIKNLEIDKDQLYNLIQLDQSGNHLLEIKFPEGDIEVYAFTFG